MIMEYRVDCRRLSGSKRGDRVGTWLLRDSKARGTVQQAYSTVGLASAEELCLDIGSAHDREAGAGYGARGTAGVGRPWYRRCAAAMFQRWL